MNAAAGKGLNAFQLKLIALVCMTLDHLAAFGFEIPVFSAYYTPLRTVGRIAAPLFLFLLVQSARHTRDRKKFLLRLYLAGAGTGLFTTATNFFLGERLGYFTPGNIIFTFFYTVLYIHLAETFWAAWKSRNGKRMLLALVLFGASFLPNLFCDWLSLPITEGDRRCFLVAGLRDSFLPANCCGDTLDYGLPFILLGTVMYFFRTPKRQCLVFAGFCAFCFLGTYLMMVCPGLGSIPYTSTYFHSLQLCMILALPLMCLYNGQRGPGRKSPFYIYYPVHRYIIFCIASFWR